MESEKYILARWLSGELEPDELADFREEEDVLLLERIIKTSTELALPAYDHDKKYAALDKKIKAFKSRRLRRLSIAAAVLLLLIATPFFLDFGKTYHSGIGEHRVVKLSDGTQVELAAGAVLRKRAFYNGFGRKVHLEGNATFKVKSGDTFTVQTEQGKITVLGTTFDVYANEMVFRVICHEGKVGVDAGGRKKELVAKMGIEVIDKQWRDLDEAAVENINWTTDRTNFFYAPLYEVFEALEKQFGIEVLGGEKFNNSFIGSFEHTSLEAAAEQIFVPMSIPYKIEGNNVIL